METYCLKHQLLHHQADFFELLNKGIAYPALVGGFGCGKTRTIIGAAIHLMIKYPGVLGGIFEPTYGDIRDIIIPEFDTYCDEYGIMHSYNNNSGIYTTSLGRVKMKSMHNPNDIKGFQIGWGFIDELDTMKPEDAELAWNKIIARARIPLPDRTDNPVGVATTPEGFGFIYKRWVEEKGDDYEIVHGKTIDNPFISEGYYKNLLSSYTVELQKAYLNGEFVNLRSGSVYYAFNRDSLQKVELDPVLPVNLCFDFNVDPGCMVITQDKSNDIRVIAEVFLRNSNTWDLCSEAKSILPKDCSVVIYGDAAGRARDTRSQSVGYSDYTIIEEELGSYFQEVSFDVPAANPSIKDRVNAVNNKLEKGHVQIHPDCKKLAKDLEQVIWKGHGLDKDNLDLTHISDAFGYYIIRKFPIIRQRNHKAVAL